MSKGCVCTRLVVWTTAVYAQGDLYLQWLGVHTQGRIDIQFSCMSKGCVCTRLVVWTTPVYVQD